MDLHNAVVNADCLNNAADYNSVLGFLTGGRLQFGHKVFVNFMFLKFMDWCNYIENQDNNKIKVNFHTEVLSSQRFTSKW